jgi:hypothetical protein
MSRESHGMNPKIPSNYSSFCKKVARFLGCEIAALSISIFLVIAIGYACISFADNLVTFPEDPSPGDGFLVLGVIYGSAFLSLWVSLTLAVLVHICVFKIFPIKIPSKYSSFFNKLARFIIYEISAFYISFFFIISCSLWFSISLTALSQIFIFKKFFIKWRKFETHDQ